MKLTDFFVDLKVTADTLVLKDMVSYMGDLKLSTLGELGALGALGGTWWSLVRGATSAATSLNLFRAQTGLSTDELQRWQNVASRSDVPIDNVTSSVTALQSKLTALKFGTADENMFRAFGMLRIDPYQNGQLKNALQIMEELPSAIRNIQDQSMRVRLLADMGLSPDMILVLQHTRSELDNLKGSAKIFSPQDIHDLIVAKENIAGLNHEMARLGETLAVRVVPHLTNLVNNIDTLIGDLAEFAAMQGKGDFLKGLFESMFPPLYVGEGAFGRAAARGAGAGGLIPRAATSPGAGFGERFLAEGLMAMFPVPQLPPSISTENNVRIDVHSSGDADATARLTADHVKRQLNRADASRNRANQGY